MVDFVIFVVVVGGAPFIVLAGMLWALDTIAIQRGLPGAHPLSPAVAWTLVLWAILFCAWVLYVRYQVEADIIARYALANQGGGK